MIKGIPDLLTFTRMGQATSDLRTRMEATSLEAVTGKKSDIAQATGRQIGEANLIKKALDDIENRSARYGMVSARIETMTAALGNVRGAMGDMGATALTNITSGDTTGMRIIATEAKSALNSVFSNLNANYGSRSLFSGDAAQSAPLGSVQQVIDDVQAIVSGTTDPVAIEAALDTYFNDPAGGFQTTIYQGGDGNASGLAMGDGSRLDYTVKADDQAVRDTIRGLAVLATNMDAAAKQPAPEFTTLITNAAGKLEAGREGMLALEAKLGVSLNIIENGLESDINERKVLNGVYQTLVGRDQYEAAAELKQIETQLQASYILTSRLTSLTLSNYI